MSVPGAYPGFEEDDSATVAYGHELETFHMLTDHFLEPGSSDLFHRSWNGAAWSEAENVSESAMPVFSSREALHASPSVPCTMASWMENDLTLPTILVRRVAQPNPGDPVDLGQAFTSQGLFINFNSRHSVTLTSDGVLHMALGESRYLEEGLWYQSFEPLCTSVLFQDGFESGDTDAWSAAP